MGIRQRSAERRPQTAAGAADIPGLGASADRLQVVCYPKRVARAAPALALTPSQALRLIHD
ncbi:MAG: hypothetical protein M3N52_08580, partial [Actinomycetota bacterium]|nr:hypothetical protein [Actinomycetota bacterium]